MEKNRKKAEKTDALKPYEAFDRRRKLLAALMLFTGFTLIIYLFYTFFFTDDGTQQIFASLWAFVYILGVEPARDLGEEPGRADVHTIAVEQRELAGYFI